MQTNLDSTTTTDAQYFWQEKQANGHLRLGLNAQGQDEVGEVSFVDYPDDLTSLQVGDVLASVESSKSVLDLYTPIAGKVAKLNVALLEHPEQLNATDQKLNWLVELY
ncbi:glycine cleavage system protein H [Lactobacillus sp. DCY120]|uniref:Glycine cleavage system protein H n=1 Tax=Bombilactobacillus apium TaxID=2675299 RepID=A0A850R7A8_9LACO|nr:glycine cleavage system protein H [Bombilactobacillus apium]NVY96415.1 glycine cleavage system protein H [Bombilactobacillus apium]